MLAGSAVIVVFLFFLISGFSAIFPNEKAFTRFSSGRHSATTLNSPALKNEYAYYAGPADAKVVVTEFFDFQCPYSKQVAPTVRQLMDRYRQSSVKFVFRQLPIEASHPFAFSAAHASLCAKEQNRFMEMYDALFNNQERIVSDDFSEFARASGSAPLRFQECMKRLSYQGVVRKDLADAETLPIQGTPTFFVNETLIEGAESLDVFVTAIDTELGK